MEETIPLDPIHQQTYPSAFNLQPHSFTILLNLCLLPTWVGLALEPSYLYPPLVGIDFVTYASYLLLGTLLKLLLGTLHSLET